MILLVVLVVISMTAALAVSMHLAERKDEIIITHGIVWTTMVVGPLYLFGLTNTLTKAVVAASTVLLSIVALWFSLRGGAPAVARFKALARTMARVPFDATAIVLRTNRLMALPVVLAVVYYLWQLAAAPFAPTWGDWDSLWYHEPIIAFNIQNHGFAIVPLPLGAQGINGFARLGEITMTFWGLYGGRRVVDVSNFFYIPMLLASMHALVARFTKDRAIPIAWAAALLLIPATMRQLRSTMIDVECHTFLLAAIFFVTHPEFTRRRMVLFLLAVTGAVGTKATAAPAAAVACLVFFIRVLSQRKELGLRWVLGSIFGGGTLVLSMMAFTHLRNWIHFHNPLWPVGFEIKPLGVRWSGAYDYVGGVDANIPLDALLHKMFQRPYTVLEHNHTWHVDDYGFGVSIVAMPIAVFACFASPLVWAGRTIWEKHKKLPRSEATRLAGLAALVALFAIVGYLASPERFVPRYTIAPMAAGLALTAWALRGPRFRKSQHSVVFFVQVASLLMMFWVIEPRPWVFSIEETWALLHTPYPLREEARKFRAPVNEPVAMLREQEIRRGDVVMFDETEVWPAMAFNNDYSNRVVWVDTSKDAMAQVQANNAKWVLTRPSSALSQQLVAAHWQPVGMIENEQWTMAYRRPR